MTGAVDLSYLYFIGGSLLLLTSAVCFLLKREGEGLLPWGLLGTAGVLLFFKRIASLAYPMYGTDGWLATAELSVLAAALVLISEAGRRALALKARYFYPPPLIFCVFAVPYGGAGLDAAVRLSFGLAGAAMVSAHLARVLRPERGPSCVRAAIALMAAGIPLYALFSAATPPPSGFLSAAFVNSDTVSVGLGLNAGAVSLFFLAMMGGGIWLYFFTYDTGCGILKSRKGRSGLAGLLSFVVLFAAGWGLTERLSSGAIRELAGEVSSHAGLLSASLADCELGADPTSVATQVRLSRSFDRVPASDRAFLVNPDGIIMAASDRVSFLKALWPPPGVLMLSPSAVGSSPRVAGGSLLSAEPADGSRVSLGGVPFMAGVAGAGRDGWRVVFLRDMGAVAMARFTGMAVTALMLLFAVFSISAYVISETAREKAEEALRLKAEVSALEGIIPICAGCKKIRDDKGYWEQVESYMSRHTDAQFSHALCPACAKKLYPKYYPDQDGESGQGKKV